jgi:hypothetical protein
MIYYDRSIAIQRESYDDYLRMREQTTDITSSIRKQTKQITDSNRENADRLAAATVATGALFAQSNRAAIMDAQAKTEGAMRENALMLDSTFQRGFSDVSGQIDDMNMTMAYGFAGVGQQLGVVERQLGAMGAEINFGLARLNDTFQKSAQSICDKLDAINDTLNNPRFTEARELYRQASTEYGKSFYEDARDESNTPGKAGGLPIVFTSGSLKKSGRTFTGKRRLYLPR